MVIECTSRFQILQKGDNIVSEHFCDAGNTFQAQTDITPATDPNLDVRLGKASQSDAPIIINRRIGQKSKLKQNQPRLMSNIKGVKTLRPRDIEMRLWVVTVQVQ